MKRPWTSFILLTFILALAFFSRTVTASSVTIGGSGLDEAAADALYLRLDAANSPLTGDLSITKASATLSLVATSGDPGVVLDGATRDIDIFYDDSADLFTIADGPTNYFRIVGSNGFALFESGANFTRTFAGTHGIKITNLDTTAGSDVRFWLDTQPTDSDAYFRVEQGSNGISFGASDSFADQFLVSTAATLASASEHRLRVGASEVHVPNSAIFRHQGSFGGNLLPIFRNEGGPVAQVIDSDTGGSARTSYQSSGDEFNIGIPSDASNLFAISDEVGGFLTTSNYLLTFDRTSNLADFPNGSAQVSGGSFSVTGSGTISTVTGTISNNFGSLNSNGVQASFSNSGSTVFLTANNTSNTAGSAASAEVKVAGASAGDPFLDLSIDGVVNASVRIDNDDADRLKLINNGNEGVQVTTTGGLGFYGTAGVAQGSAVSDASGGATIDAEARTAINALLSRIRDVGLIAP